jgi:hypothetical protein
MPTQVIDISVYRDVVPEFVREPLERLYRHLHSSLAYHSIYGDVSNGTNTCVLQQGGELVAVLLFRVEGNQVRVLNEQCSFDSEVIKIFSRLIFDDFPFAHIISFPVIANPPAALDRPFQHAKCTQDIVLTLPESVNSYMAKMGKSTRNYIKRYSNKLKRCFPSVSSMAYAGSSVDDEQIRAIIELNHARMSGKHKRSYIDESETERIIRLVRQCGLVTVVTIDGKVCAGTINYRIADNYFLHVIAHDPLYDEYGLGTLCCYLAICECIERKGCEYHFLWGRYEYKYRLLGEQRDLSHLLIYRSRFHMVRNGVAAIRHACRGPMYDAKDWIERRTRRVDNSNKLGQMTYYCLNGLKKAKRSADRIRMRKSNTSASP